MAGTLRSSFDIASCGSGSGKYHNAKFGEDIGLIAKYFILVLSPRRDKPRQHLCIELLQRRQVLQNTDSCLSKDMQGSEVISGVVESEVAIQTSDRIQLALLHVKSSNLQVLLETLLVVTLGNDGQSSLSSPSQKHLGRSLAVLLSNDSNNRVFEKNRGVLSLLELKLKE